MCLFLFAIAFWEDKRAITIAVVIIGSNNDKSDNFCYRKVYRVITKWGLIEEENNNWTAP